MSIHIFKANSVLSSFCFSKLTIPVICRCCQVRCVSSKKNNPQVVISKDESAVMAWHPEPSFPYEHTKELPRNVPEIQQGDSVLKVQHLMEEKLKYRPTGPTISELANIFHTTKHRWYPKPEKKYRKPNPPKDRDSL